MRHEIELFLVKLTASDMHKHLQTHESFKETNQRKEI